jgi:hypothetical protein
VSDDHQGFLTLLVCSVDFEWWIGRPMPTMHE